MNCISQRIKIARWLLAATVILSGGACVRADYVLTIDNFGNPSGAANPAFLTTFDQAGNTQTASQTYTPSGNGSIPSPNPEFVRKLARGDNTTSVTVANSNTLTHGSANAAKQSAVSYNLQQSYGLNSISLQYSSTSPASGNVSYSVAFLILDAAQFASGAVVTTTPVPVHSANVTAGSSGTLTYNAPTLTSAQYLQVRVNRNTSTANPGSTNFSFVSLTASAVPEPGTILLFGLTGVAAVVAHRRRSKAQRDAAAAADPSQN